MRYSDLKKTIKLLRKYRYRRNHKSSVYMKYWYQGISCYSIMIDINELALINFSIEDYLLHMESKAERVLGEMEE